MMKDHVAAVAQLPIAPLDSEANTVAAITAVEEAARLGASLVVLPELGNTGYVTGRDRDFMRRFLAQAERIPGPYSSALREQAVRTGSYVIGGVCEINPDVSSVLLNTAVLCTPDGDMHLYRKTHIPSEEKHYFLQGHALRPFDTDLGRIGLLICADNSFPEAARLLALRGAEILAVPYSARRPVNPDLYTALAVTRAYENQVFVVFANCVGEQHGLEFVGGSGIAAPDGRLIARLGPEPGVRTASLTNDVLESERLWQTRYRDRRPDLYGQLAEQRDPSPAADEWQGLAE